MPSSHTPILLFASTDDANMFYATRFLVPDPFIFLQVNNRKIILMSDLEVDRAKSEAKVDEVLSLSELSRKIGQETKSKPKFFDILEYVLREYQIQELSVPANFPLLYADKLRERGFTLRAKADPFFEQRVIKTDEEVRAVEQAIRHTEAAIDQAVRVMKASEIRGPHLYFEGAVLTAEKIKEVINVELMKRNCVAINTIVASGPQGVDPHDRGSGPLLANASIIMDVFPRDLSSNYHADISRTVCRGKASDKLKRMFDAVLHTQQMGCGMVREGIDGSEIHRAITDYFNQAGFTTGSQNGRMQGFFHGTGHGLGLDVHEEPRVSTSSDILQAGQIVTIEPGLYYADAGGIRIEDDVLVTKTGGRNLVTYPKFFEI